MENKMLIVNNLKSMAGEKEILKGLDLSVGKGEIHVVMGPNGAGKSTLAYTLMGHPKYKITAGKIFFNDQEINDLKADERAKRGIFLSFQHPEELPGITVENFIRSAKVASDGKPIKLMAFRKELKETMEDLKMKEEYASRFLNVGFSGGEKKKNEILQMAILKPKFVILDEADSGLDVDAIKVVAEGVKKYATEENSVLIITHHNKILEYLKPDFVHVLIDGKIVKTGDYRLALEIEEKGYEELIGKAV